MNITLRSFKISLCLCVLLCSCYTCFRTRYIYEPSLSDILGGIKEVDIKDKVNWAPFLIRDPYTMEIYTLSSATIKEFEELKVKRLEEKFFDEDSRWRKIEWHPTPIDSAFQMVWLTATCIPTFDDARLSVEMNKIENIVHHPGSYYAFYYIPFHRYVPRGRMEEIEEIAATHVCFFLLDISNKKLYILDI